MGLLRWMRRRLQPPGRKADINEILSRLGGGGATVAGVVVNETTALQVNTVFACVSLIANDVAAMPLHVKRRRGDEEAPAVEAPEYELLFRRPNEWQTAFEFRQMMTAQAVLRGDAYAYKVFDGEGRVREIWPLMASECTPRRADGAIVYDVNAYDGRWTGIFPRERIFHLRGFTWNGVRGLDRVSNARDSIALASAASGTQANAFRNGARLAGYWSTDNMLDGETIDRLERELRAATTSENQYRSPVLDAGIQFHSVAQNFDDAQLIETRKHQMIEICAAFNVVPAVLGIDDKTQAFASVEAMMRWHLQHTLRPWLMAWEQTIDRDILDTARGPLFARFDTAAMEKASTAERAQFYRELMDTLVMMPNEARRLEGLPPIDGLDEMWLAIRKGMAGIDGENRDAKDAAD